MNTIQKIDSAPLDGTEILAWTGSTWEMAFHSPERKRWYGAHHSSSYGHELYHITHWLPMPPNPNDQNNTTLESTPWWYDFVSPLKTKYVSGFSYANEDKNTGKIVINRVINENTIIDPNNQNNTMPESEDLRRYTAPPDNPPEERTYYTSDILDYIESCFPKMSISAYSTYSIDEIRNMLKEAADNLTDEDYGIATI